MGRWHGVDETEIFECELAHITWLCTLHRAALAVLQCSQQVAKWVELADKVGQVAHVSGDRKVVSEKPCTVTCLD